MTSNGHLSDGSFERRGTTKRTAGARGKAKRVLDRKPAFQGWRTTDEEELERRRWRGKTEVTEVEPSEEDGHPFFGTFRVRSSSGGEYEVEIRSLVELDNSCGCHDHRVNGLGTCKHIEGVLDHLRRRGAAAFGAAARQGSPWVELFLARRGDPAVRLSWPADSLRLPARALLARHLPPDGSAFAGDPVAAIEAIRQAVAAMDPEIRGPIRISRHLDAWIAEQRRRSERLEAKRRFEAALADGRESLDMLRHPLLPYQREGALHLAFGERALLADEMGLGKTIQAIAACELLRRTRGVERALVVGPASLKAEWEEQIARFSDLPVRIISGSRPKRLHQYGQPGFFHLANYEQILTDAPDINRILRPDIVILDEAQRIKNWQTKTAHAVKRLASPYAFVLTGTPLENRIDELYSIVQYLDPGALGPLFRFNREFYELDERGRPSDYNNLEELRRRLQPIMLRRRKADVEEQLPPRTVKTYFVAMAAEQQMRYADYEAQAARILAIARRRPLMQAEFERLQLLLACMRMVCDTPYILDPDCRVSPKLIELEGILGDLLAESDRKIIVFSEWERMLELVRELAGEMEVEFAWHTGSVPQDKRRAEINRFKKDPACRLFLSTDSGSVGLNLQAANAVVNLDLPWNPAKLEQRIARAWRKNQMRAVSVVNLVCENSIEHRMVHLLTQKQNLADGVLDGIGDLKSVRMPSGRAAFVERLAAMMARDEGRVQAPPPPRVDAAERTRQALLERYGERLLLLERRRDAGGKESVLAVLDVDAGAAGRERQRLLREQEAGTAAGIEVVDRATFETIRRLVEAGALSFAGGAAVELHRSAGLAVDRDAQRRAQARDLLAKSERKLRMASLLCDGGFALEAKPPLAEAVRLAIGSRAVLADEAASGESAGASVPPELVDRFVGDGLLPQDAVALVAALGAGAEADDFAVEQRMAVLLDSAERLIDAVRDALGSDSPRLEHRALAAE